CNNKEKLDFIIEHIDSQNNMRLQIINAQGYKNAIAILRDNESLLKQMKQTTSLISILNMLRENKDLIRHYITLGFTPESMGLILFIQRTQLKYTFKILDDNKSLFANKLEHFSEDKLTAHLLEQNDKIETFGMRVELLKTGQASRSLSVTSAAVRRILSSQRTEQIPNRDSRINFSPRSFRN
ncbi:MAG TPA: hypothetical protein VI522_00825, partial [Gammaproteobacteria bacterium]|nr:hypothetical protein [Gammaproteobacteria bacterium]